MNKDFQELLDLITAIPEHLTRSELFRHINPDTGNPRLMKLFRSLCDVYEEGFMVEFEKEMRLRFEVKRAHEIFSVIQSIDILQMCVEAGLLIPIGNGNYRNTVPMSVIASALKDDDDLKKWIQ